MLPCVLQTTQSTTPTTLWLRQDGHQTTNAASQYLCYQKRSSMSQSSAKPHGFSQAALCHPLSASFLRRAGGLLAPSRQSAQHLIGFASPKIPRTAGRLGFTISELSGLMTIHLSCISAVVHLLVSLWLWTATIIMSCVRRWELFDDTTSINMSDWPPITNNHWPPTIIDHHIRWFMMLTGGQWSWVMMVDNGGWKWWRIAATNGEWQRLTMT